jgi:hypothetical protein
MDGHLITVEGNTIRYLTAGERLQFDDQDNPIGFDLLEDRDLEYHPRLRRVLTTLVRPQPTFYGVLHWNDGTDLEELDRKVLENKASDEDFAGALLAQPRTIICPNCESQLRVLAVDTGQALFAKTLAERLRTHNLKSKCPVCQNFLSVPIVEFITKSGNS